MHARLLPAVGVSALALVAAAAFAPTANASSTHVSPSHHGTATPIQGAAVRPTCFSNLEGDTGDALTSQNFESDFDVYDAMGADNFTLRNKCNASSIVVVGQYYNGIGPADSENVTFYANDHGAPGDVISAQTVAGVDNGLGSFTIPLDPIHLAPGRYWVSVQVNMDLTVGGQWGWENTANQAGKPALWQNPGDGFGTGCTTWSNLETCLGAPGPDLMFAVYR